MREEENHAERFYESLRAQDRDNVRGAVRRMKEAGFDVYATGSSLDTEGYNDIDLLVTPEKNSKMTINDSIGRLEGVVKSLTGVKIVIEEERNSETLVDYPKPFEDEVTYMGSEFLNRIKVELEPPLQPPYIELGDFVRPTYQASFVATRKFIDYSGDYFASSTKLDIVLTHNPFGVIPETKRIKL